MDRSVQILIIARQRASRQSLRALLTTWTAASSILEVENFAEALMISQSISPDLVILDLPQLESSDLKLIKQIKSLWSHTRVVCLSMYPDALSEARLAGAEASISKSDPPESLLRSLESIL